MKKILILFLSILVISCSSEGINAGLGDSGNGGGETISSDALNFTLSDAQLSNDKAGFTGFEIKDGYVVGGSDTIVYFSVPTLRADISTIKISQLEIMTALDEAFSTAITNQTSLRGKLAPDAVDVVVVEIDYPTGTRATTATVVVRLFAAEGYKFGSSVSSARSRGMDPKVKDIIIKVAVDSTKPTRTGATEKIGKVVITEFDYYLAPTKTDAGVEYTKINLNDSATFDNLVIIPPIGSKYIGRTTADEAIKSFILNATKHGTSLKTDGTVVSTDTLKLTVDNRARTDVPQKHSIKFTISKADNYFFPKNYIALNITVSSTLSSGKFVDGTVITDAAINTIKFKDQDIGKAKLNASGLANGAVTVSGTGIVTPTQVQKAVSNSITGSTGTYDIGVDNNFSVAMPTLSGSTMTTKVTINARDSYLFEDSEKTKTIPIIITATGGVTFHSGIVDEATLIAELDAVVKKLNGKEIVTGAKFSGAKITKAGGFTADITSTTAGTELTKDQITSGVRSLLATEGAPTGIKEEYIELKNPTISDSGKTFKATVTFKIADGYTGAGVKLSYNVTFKADENVAFQ